MEEREHFTKATYVVYKLRREKDSYMRNKVDEVYRVKTFGTAMYTTLALNKGNEDAPTTLYGNKIDMYGYVQEKDFYYWQGQIDEEGQEVISLENQISFFE